MTSGKYVRHGGYILHLSPFQDNNYDFAWKFESGPKLNIFYIYNPYKDRRTNQNMYIGYEQNTVRIMED